MRDSRAPAVLGGAMTADGRAYWFQQPWLGTIPDLAILISATAFNLLGDAVRDLLDPRARGRDSVRTRNA
jgi:peptide/nickel transport system permease protein